MKEWMVGVNGAYWRIKADDYRIGVSVHGGNLAEAVFFQKRTLREPVTGRVEEVSEKVGHFVGEMVVVFDPSEDVMVTKAGGVAPTGEAVN